MLLVTSVVLTLVLLEVLTPHLYSLLHGKPFPREQLLTKLDRRLATWKESNDQGITNLPSHIANKVIHPYLGFIADPIQSNIDPYGFFGDGSFPEDDPTVINVALLGGSVALDSCSHFGGALAAGLTDSELDGRGLRVYCLAMDGYKQPQQLLTLTYFMVLGAKFDLVVNLDGFNEITLPYAENMNAGVNAFYPRSWQLFSRSLVTPSVAEKVVELHRKKSEYEWWRSRFDSPLGHWSSLFLLIWEAVEGRKSRAIALADKQLQELVGQSPELPRDLGPPSQYHTLESMLRDLVRAWAESSALMAQLCKSSNSKYFHFLQPNQYVPEGKPLSEWEQSNATTPGPFQDAAQMGYPQLIEEGNKLTESGIPFWDLTQIFSGHAETLYSDNCCHLNDRGYRLLTERMVTIILDKM